MSHVSCGACSLARYPTFARWLDAACVCGCGGVSFGVRVCVDGGGGVPNRLQFVELDERQDGNAIRYELSQITGRTSVPQIWIDGEFVGGCNDGASCFPACFCCRSLHFRLCTYL